MSKIFPVLGLLFLAACGGEAPAPAPAPAPVVEAPAPAPVEAAPATPADPGPKGSLIINPDDNSAAQELAFGTKGDEMAFDVAELSAKAGQNIRIKFTNKATAAGMVHNIVVVKAGDVEAVANAGMTAGEGNGYVPNNEPKVLATGKLTQPGGADSFLLKPLEAGDYILFCSFPGHYMTMQIKLKVA